MPGRKSAYPLDEILLLALLAVPGGAEGWVDVAYFGRRKLDDKSNEITAIPELLDLLTLNSAIGSISYAMISSGCKIAIHGPD